MEFDEFGDPVSTDGTNNGTLTASTGKNDPNSVWGTLSNVFTSGTNVYNSITGKKPATAAKSTLPTWLLPVAVGGGLLLVVLFVVMGRK